MDVGTPDRYVEVAVADAITADVASGAAWSLGAVAIEEAAAPDGGVVLRIGPGPGGADELAARLRAAGYEARVLTPERSVGDFLAEEARTPGARRIGVHLVLVPIAADRPLTHPRGGPADVVVRIDPGRAFGSGSHPTTRLCLELLEEHVGGGETVLDVGTGSGVLAVAAAKLGARRVLAVDVDPEAVRVAAANAVSNGVGPLVEVTTTPVAEVSGSFDVVVANVLAGTLVDLAADLSARVASDGVLVLSGIIESRVAVVADGFAALGWRVADQRVDEGWVALVLTRDC